VLVTAAAVLAITVVPAAAGAAPATPTTPEQAAQLVATTSHELEAVSEQVNEAGEVLAQQQAAAAAATQAVADAQARVDALDAEVRQVARSAYTGDSLSRFNALMKSESAEQFIAQVNTLDVLAAHTNDLLAQADVAAAAAEQARLAADAASAAAQQSLDTVTAQQSALQAMITDYQAQYDQLTAAQQAEVARRVAGPALEAPAEVRAVREPAPDDTEPVTAEADDPASDPAVAPAPPPAAAAPNGNADAVQVAIDTALAQIGDPYVWAAAGPRSFDCSGLTQFAYAAAGIKLPHSSRMQSTMGTAVPRAALRPGDLVFFRSPVSHVGMYIGNGKMVHAPTPGTSVQVTSVDMAGYAGARRYA
jgi:cell wall-associated NlpC family hydrolase